MTSHRRHPAGAPDAPATQGSEPRLRASEPGAAEGERHPPSYTRVREILRRYLSPILVSSVLDKAMMARNVSPETMSSGALAEITGDIMVGLRLFVPEDRLPQLMLELAEVLEAEHK